MRLDTGVDALSPILDGRGLEPIPASPARAVAADDAVDLQVSLVIDGSQATEWLAGEIDTTHCDGVYELGALAVAEYSVDALVVDFSGVTFLDAAGVGALIRLRNVAARARTRLALRAVPPPVAKVLTITDLSRTFGLPLGDGGRC